MGPRGVELREGFRNTDFQRAGPSRRLPPPGNLLRRHVTEHQLNSLTEHLLSVLKGITLTGDPELGAVRDIGVIFAPDLSAQVKRGHIQMPLSASRASYSAAASTGQPGRLHVRRVGRDASWLITESLTHETGPQARLTQAAFRHLVPPSPVSVSCGEDPGPAPSTWVRGGADRMGP